MAFFWKRKYRKGHVTEKPKLLKGNSPAKGLSAIVYTGNGAHEQIYKKLFSKYAVKGEVFTELGGIYDLTAIQYITDESKEDKVINGFHHKEADFLGFTARKKEHGTWKWYGSDGKWHALSADMTPKMLFQHGQNIDFVSASDNTTIILDAQWRNAAGEILSCGYQMFSNKLMAHSFGGYEGKTYHNTIPAFMEGIKNGYRYFEVDLSYTTDERLVLCHGWSESNCKWTGFEYKPEFANMTYSQIMNMKVHGNDIIDARTFYKYLLKYPKYTFEIDFHPYKGVEIQKRIEAMLGDFRYNQQVLDRLLIQAYSAEMYEDMDKVYHFKHYQYLVGKNIDKLDEIIQYALDNGICVLALRANLAKPEYVQKIRNAGLYVMCYTVNQDLQVAKKLLDSGVNTLCTDFITEKALDAEKGCMGHHPFYVYYNSGVEGAENLYDTDCAVDKMPSGTLEFRDKQLWPNDGKRALRKCAFQVPGKKFVGWKLRVRVDEKVLWYCKDHCYHTKGDFVPNTLVEPYLFQDEEIIPIWTLKEGMKLIMVAEWVNERRRIMKNKSKLLLCGFIAGAAILMANPVNALAANNDVLISRSSVEEGYTVNGTTITMKVASGDSIVKPLNKAIKYAKETNPNTTYTVKVPKGSYKLDGTIHVYGNIVLDLTGVTLTYNLTEGNMLMLGDSDINTNAKTMSGYGTLKNITIKGGVWKGNKNNTSSLIRMAHSENVTLEGCTFSGGGCAHQVEVAAIKNFVVKKCTFKDMPGNGTDEKQEALQFDMPCSEYVFGGVVLDGTPMKDVTVTECTFSNVPRGVGSHSMLVGTYHENVNITNNTFKNVAGECVVALCYYDCDITGNVIEDCGAGILVQYFKPEVKAVYNTIYDGASKATGKTKYDSKTNISNNTITIVKSDEADKSVGIKVYGYNLPKKTTATGIGSKDVIAKNDYYISGVTVSNNTITTWGSGIQFLDTKKSTIKDNTIVCTGSNEFDGIFLEFASTENVIENNNITKAPRYGICLQNKSSAASIANNTIDTSKSYGIYLYNESAATAIANNTVKNAKATGIFLNKKCTATSIANNTITAPAEKGIYILDASKVTDSIANNSITSAGDRGIGIEKNSEIKNITNNTISTSAGHGIYLYNSAKVTDSISKNTISSCKQNAIFINKKSTVKNITSNTITSPKGKGIYVLDSSKVTSAIKSNTISNGKDRGISIEKSSTIKNISKNTIKASANYAIYLYNSSKVTGSISENKITSAKQNGLFLNKKSSAGSITKNTITKANGKAIYVEADSTVKKSISGNIIDSAKKEGINICSIKNDVVIEGNTIKKCSSWPVFVKAKPDYVVTIKDNELYSKKAYTVVQVSAGNVKVDNNILSSGKWGVCINKGATGTIGKNTLKSNKNNTYMVLGTKSKGTNVKNNGKKATLSSVKSSKKKEITVKWKKVSNSKGYVIQYATSKDFSDAVSVDVAKGTKTTIKGLKSKTTYYVRICSVKKVNGVLVYQPYSKTKTVKVK